MKKDINQLFKDALSDYEKPYNPQAWNNIKGQLPKSGLAGSATTWVVGSLSVAALVGIVYFANQSTNKQQNTVQKDSIEQTTLSNQNNTTKNTTSAQKLAPKLDAKEENTNNQNTSQVLTTNTIAGVNSTTTANNNSNNTDLKESNNTSNSDGQNNVNHPKENVVSTPNTLKFVEPKISVSATQVCAGQEVELTAQSLDKSYKMSWTTSNGEVLKGQQIKISPKENTTVTAVVIDDQLKRHEIANIQITVIVINEPNIQVKEDLKNTKAYFTLDVKNAEGNQIQWNLDYLNARGNSFGFYLTKKGNHEVTMSVKSADGCSAKFTKTVYLANDYNLFAPNAFIPTQSINNEFIPKALLSRDVDFKMVMMDRSGNVIYQTTDKTAPWAGKLTNGELAPTGTYLWIVTLINEEGSPEKYTGELLLMQ